MRRSFLRLAVIVVLLGLSPAATTERAFACDCTPLAPLEAFEDAVAVFSGRAVAISGDFPVDITFDVYSVWKGPEASEIVVTTSILWAGDCGYPFEQGGEYLVYAFDEALVVWLCGGTVPLQYAQDEVALLDAGQPGGAGVADSGEAAVPPQPPAAGTGLTDARPTASDTAHWSLLAAAVVLAAAGAVLMARRTRHT